MLIVSTLNSSLKKLIDSGEPAIAVSVTSNYGSNGDLWDTAHDHGGDDVAFWRPQPTDGTYYTVGDLMLPSYGPPLATSMIIRVINGANDSQPLVVPPVQEKWQRIWHDLGSGAPRNGSIWRPYAPDGYVVLGHVLNAGYYPPDLGTINYACIRHDYAQLIDPSQITTQIWNDHGTRAQEDVAGWILPGTAGCFVAQPNHDAWNGIAYQLKPATSL